MTTRGRALILQPGGARNALAAARALAKGGWTVGVGSPERDFVSASRSVSSWHLVPSPWEGVEEFTEAVRPLVAGEGYEVVFGAGDAQVLALSANRGRLGAPVGYPPHERVAAAFDKLELSRAAERAGLATPRVLDPAQPFDEGDVVIKPRVNALLYPRVAMLPSESVPARQLVQDLEEAGIEPLVQERVDGGLMAYTVLADDSSRVRARVQQEAEAIWPPHAGISVRARTVAIDPELATGVERLVEGMGWSGLAQLQFLVPSAGPPVLIDFNGRFYGSLALAGAAGLNLPAMWAAMATGQPVEPAREAAVGVRYQWLEGDLRRARATHAGDLAGELGRCARYAVGATHSLWSAADPAPALLVLSDLVGASARFRARALWRAVR